MSKGLGSVFGGMLLIAGSCIGAGMLGLPIVTGLCGFYPTLVLFCIAWLFMTASALLLVEINSCFSKPVNLLTMSKDTLGKTGTWICSLTYLFLFYALLVAYISGIGGLASTFFNLFFHVQLPAWIGSLFFVALFGWIIYLGTRRVDLCNRTLMLGKIGFFLLLVITGVSYIQPLLLKRVEVQYMGLSLPLIVLSFGFHNIIPSLFTYLKGNVKRVRLTIIGGSLCVFAIYLVWEILVLGIVPISGENGLVASLKNDKEASQALAAIIQSPSVSLFSQGLAFFAILTSFLAQSLSLSHFLADAVRISYKKHENTLLCLLALVPPLLCSLIYPQLFFKALNFAGGICAVILFGMLPVAMVWKRRYGRRSTHPHGVPGGKYALGAIFVCSLAILLLQLASMCGASFMKPPI